MGFIVIFHYSAFVSIVTHTIRYRAKIIDGSGNIYQMGKNRSNTVVAEKHSKGKMTAWPVNYITTPYSEEIRFTYKEYDIQNLEKKSTLNVSEARINSINYASDPTTQYSISESSSIPDYKKVLLIDVIETDFLTVKFERYESSMPELAYFVKKISIKDKDNNTVKTISFTHQTKSTTCWHYLLKTLTINDQLYRFDYYDAPSNNFYTNLYDQWGYYLNRTSGTSFGNILPLHEEFKEDNIIAQAGAVIEMKKLMNITGASVIFTDRSKNEAAPHYFSLKCITFPTGGKTEYIYEPNQYAESLKTIKGCGQRIAKIQSTTNGSDKIVTEFKYGENENGNGFPSFYLSYRDFANESAYFSLNAGLFEINRCHVNKTYMADPLITEMSNTVVHYNKVTANQFDTNNNQKNGKTISIYEIPKEYQTGDYDKNVTFTVTNQITLNIQHYGKKMISSFNKNYKPLMKHRILINNSSDTVRKETFTYRKRYNTVPFYSVKIDQKAFFDSYFTNKYGVYDQYNFVNTVFGKGRYSINLGLDLLLSKKTASFLGNAVVYSTELYEYDDSNLLTKTTQTTSDNNRIIETKTYPSNYSSQDPYSVMISKNMLNYPVESQVRKNETFLSLTRNTYQKGLSSNNNLVLPSFIETQTKEQPISETRIRYHKYDSYGNPACVSYENGPMIIYIWGYKGQYPVAKIETTNKESSYYSTVVNAIGSANITTLSGTPTDTQVKNIFANLRANSNLAGVLITSYTYKPLIGMTSETDPSGRTIFYEYDDFGRLKCIKDEDGKIIKEHQYHYAQ